MAKLQPVKMTAAGQISIPKPLREGFCEPGDYLILEPYADGLLLRRVTPYQEPDGPPVIRKSKQEKDTGLSDPIDWEMEEVSELGPATDAPAAEPTSDQAKEDYEESGEQRRKDMWKALLESRAK